LASPFLRYTKGILSGEFKVDGLLPALIKGVVDQHDQEERGVGRQNMRYMPELDAFSAMLLTISPAAYRLIEAELPLRSIRGHK
jgi:hypothetical protein